MTVRELIEQLSKCDPNAEVLRMDDDDEIPCDEPLEAFALRTKGEIPCIACVQRNRADVETLHAHAIGTWRDADIIKVVVL